MPPASLLLPPLPLDPVLADEYVRGDSEEATNQSLPGEDDDDTLSASRSGVSTRRVISKVEMPLLGKRIKHLRKRHLQAFSNAPRLELEDLGCGRQIIEVLQYQQVESDLVRQSDGNRCWCAWLLHTTLGRRSTRECQPSAYGPCSCLLCHALSRILIGSFFQVPGLGSWSVSRSVRKESTAQRTFVLFKLGRSVHFVGYPLHAGLPSNSLGAFSSSCSPPPVRPPNRYLADKSDLRSILWRSQPRGFTRDFRPFCF